MFKFIHGLIIVLAIFAMTRVVCAQSDPNIIIMLVDDLGYSSIETYGGDIETPVLDDLATNGAKFTNYYVQPRCSPTRAALMTGHQNHKVGFSVLSGSGTRLTQNHVFLPEMLQDNGYSTYLSGKWHLGATDNFGSLGAIPGNTSVDPRVRGFDHAFTFVNSSHSERNWTISDYRMVSDDPAFLAPSARYVEDTNNDYNRYDANGVFVDSGAATPEFYQTDAIVDYSLDFLQHHRNQNTANGTNNPFFQYIAFGAPHFPVEAPSEVTNKYATVHPDGTVTGVYAAGWDAVRTDRLQSMINKGIIPSDLVMAPRGDAYADPNIDGGKAQLIAWDDIPASRKPELVRNMAVYAAMVDVVDQQIGRLVSDLKANDEFDNTLIMFMTDNGMNAEGQTYGGGENPQQDDPDNNILNVTELEQLGGAVGLYTGTNHTVGAGWAHLDATPFRNYKHHTHEGGIASPLIVSWPDGLHPSLTTSSTNYEDQNNDVMHVADVMPTILDLLDIDLPEQYTALNGTTYDVVDFHSTTESWADLLTNGTELGEREFGIEHEGNRMYRKGDWKIVSSNFVGNDGDDSTTNNTLATGESPVFIGANEWELYNLADDPAELNNLAGVSAHNAIFNELLAKYSLWAFETNVNSSFEGANSDFNFDGVLDQLDVQLFLNNWLKVHPTGGNIDSYMLGDRNFDGLNDLADWVLIREDFMAAGQIQLISNGLVQVPEPATALSLSILLGLMLIASRRQGAVQYPVLALANSRVSSNTSTDERRLFMHHQRSKAIGMALVVAALFGMNISDAKAQAEPNILIILTDDLGYSDLGSYGGEISTPNLDELANEGVRFKNFNVAPRCSPTRAALMTGHQNHKVGFNVLIGDNGRLNQNHVFLPELLQANNYHTYMSGKWHLGGTTNFGTNGTIPGNNNTDPRVRGFDHVYTFDNSSHSENNWNPNAYRLLSSASTGNPAVAERTYQTHPGSTQYIPGTTFYQTDAITDYTLDFLNHHRSRNTANGTDNPFFSYMAFGAPHFPIEAPKSLVDQYVTQYQAGWDAVRADRLQNMINLGIVDSNLLLPPRSDVPPTNQSGEAVHQIRSWDSLSADRQADLVRRMASYAAMVDLVDQNIGRVVDDLEANGELDNTIIMFLSDNGGDAEWHEYGFSVNETIRTGQDLLNMGTNADTGPTVFYGAGWANVSNTPFDNYKHYTHEGGVNSPFIVRWGDGIDENLVGGIVDDTLTVNDIMPTLLSILDIDLPETWTAQNGNQYDVEPFHSTLVSFDQLLTDGTSIGPRDYGIQHEGNRAFQSGDWKIVSSNFSSPTRGTSANEWELYDLANDPLEQNNLAQDPQHANIFNELLLKYDVWAFQNNVSNTLPIDNSDFNFDGVQDAADIQLFMQNWLSNHQGGGSVNSYMLGDRNLDGINDLADWVIMRQDFMAVGQLALLEQAAFATPEPSSLFVCIVGLLAFVNKRNTNHFSTLNLFQQLRAAQRS